MTTATLTREAVLAMEAGAEMDALVATRVMGWTNPTGFEARWHCNGVELDSLHAVEGGGGDYYQPDQAWQPSTDIAAAWEVVEKCEQDGVWWKVCPVLDGNGGITTEKICIMTHHGNRFAASAPTAPLAICRAALLATLEPTP